MLDQDIDEAVDALAADLNMTRQDLLRTMKGGHVPVPAEGDD